MYFFNSYFIPSPFSLSFFLSFCLGVALPLQSHRPTLNLFTPTNIKHVSFTTSLYSVTQPFKLMLCRRHLWYILRRLDYSAAIQELFSFLGIGTKHFLFSYGKSVTYSASYNVSIPIPMSIVCKQMI